MQQKLGLGRATIYPAGPVEAGAYVSVKWTYTADHPVDDTGFVKICFRQIGDFGTPQFADPGAPNYCTVGTSGDCRVTPRWDAKGHTRPWSRALFLQVGKGYLARGETIEVLFGDTRGGSPGWQMSTFVQERLEFKTLVDPIATYVFKELPESPALRVAAGRPVRSLCIAPSQVITGEPFTYRVKAEDRWGNPVQRPAEHHHPGFQEAGTAVVTVTDELTALTVDSNPIRVVPAQTPRRPYWADFHGQSEETVGSGSLEDYFRFARDYGLLDIIAHQGNDFQVTDELWAEINKATARHYTPGRLVTFPGYEWSGNTPLGGDRNVYFVAEGASISHSSTDLLPQQTTAHDISPTAGDLFGDLRRSPIQPFVFAHVGGRYADLAMHDAGIEAAVEIHSAWGTFGWLLDEALELGYRVGIVANSDGHKGRPGASYPGAGEFGSLGGLTCVLAEKLDRESIHAAIAARHCYATTGNRPLLEVTVHDAGGRAAMMGDVLAVTGTPVLDVLVAGSAGLEAIEVHNGPVVIARYVPATGRESSNRLRLAWEGAEVKGRARLARWDGSLKVTGNKILSATPVNFWNANWPLHRVGEDQLRWRSSTTGGQAGVIIELESANSGCLTAETGQGSLTVELAALGAEPAAVDCGGLGKRLALYRLAPAGSGVREFGFSLPLTDLHSGDNPVFVRVVQEDGHLAWSSPVYLSPSAR